MGLKNRIHRVGIELEGGWMAMPPGVDRLVHDGSVEFPVRTIQHPTRGRILDPDAPPGPSHKGELPSKPMSSSEWPAWVRANYPSHVNETCGLHIHVSFRNALHYQLIMHPELTRMTIQRLTDWAGEQLDSTHPIWMRLAGRNRYCVDNFEADSQARARNKPSNRYTMWNYPYLLHSTAECRVLPMFADAETAIEALNQIIDTVNLFLVRYAKVDRKFTESLLLSAGGVREEISDRL